MFNCCTYDFNKQTFIEAVKSTRSCYCNIMFHRWQPQLILNTLLPLHSDLLQLCYIVRLVCEPMVYKEQIVSI